MGYARWSFTARGATPLPVIVRAAGCVCRGSGRQRPDQADAAGDDHGLHEFQLGRLTDVPAHPTEPWGDSMKRWNERYPTWRYGRPETFQYHAVQAWRVFLSKRPLDGDGDATQTVSGAGWRKGKKLKRPGDFSRTPA